MAFVQRQIVVTVGGATLGPGLRISCHLENAGTPRPATANVRIYGMTFDQMNQLSTLGQAIKQSSTNPITIQAGDTQNGLATVFSGFVETAISDFQGGPNLPFQITATSIANGTGTNTQPTSFNQKSVQVPQILQQLAGKMSLQLENNGVSTNLSYPYFWGSVWNQIRSCCEAAGIGYTAEKGVLAIWPPGGQRQGFSNVISPTTGMVGYPSAFNTGIRVKVLYTPPGYNYMSQVQVSGSQITRANGPWTIMRLDYDLECFKPNGQWFVYLGLQQTGQGGGPTAPP